LPAPQVKDAQQGLAILGKIRQGFLNPMPILAAVIFFVRVSGHIVLGGYSQHIGLVLGLDLGLAGLHLLSTKDLKAPQKSRAELAAPPQIIVKSKAQVHHC
jgi:hypothetical protein